MLICNLWILVPYLMTQNPSPANLLFNVCKLSLCHPNKTSKSATGLCSATSPTTCKQCLLLVSWKEIYQMLKCWNTYQQGQPEFIENNHLVTNGLLRKGCFVRLKSFQANLVKGKKFVTRFCREMQSWPPQDPHNPGPWSSARARWIWKNRRAESLGK